MSFRTSFVFIIQCWLLPQHLILLFSSYNTYILIIKFHSCFSFVLKETDNLMCSNSSGLSRATECLHLHESIFLYNAMTASLLTCRTNKSLANQHNIESSIVNCFLYFYQEWTSVLIFYQSRSIFQILSSIRCSYV